MLPVALITVVFYMFPTASAPYTRSMYELGTFWLLLFLYASVDYFCVSIIIYSAFLLRYLSAF